MATDVGGDRRCSRGCRSMVAVALVLACSVLGGCGRIWYDPLDPPGIMARDDAAIDASAAPDGRTSDGSASAADVLEGCVPPAGTPELAYRFTASTPGDYSIGAGTGFPLQLPDAACSRIEGCIGRNLLRTFDVGDSVVVVVERQEGGCGPFTLTVSMLLCGAEVPERAHLGAGRLSAARSR